MQNPNPATAHAPMCALPTCPNCIALWFQISIRSGFWFHGFQGLRIARGHYNIWKRYIELQCSRANFERRMFADLPNGLARNVTEISTNALIDTVITVHHRDAFAEYNRDAFQILLGSDDESGED